MAEPAPTQSLPLGESRLCATGKVLRAGSETFFVRGVTYGTFRPDADGHPYPDRLVVEKDFSQMAAQGINALRTYTVPPLWLLDLADQQDLRVLLGLNMESRVGSLCDGRPTPNPVEELRRSLRPVAGHPAILGYALANEIPAPAVRWHGPRRIEAFLRRLCDAVRASDPDALVTYVNYPTTEYLQLPFLDFLSMNVYLEEPSALEGYLARLQNLAGERPLLLTELGLDSLRHGEKAQARSIERQLRSSFAAGCAGAFVYAWTDEWHRGGTDILDWEFGITRRDRLPKPALHAVRRAFAELPFPADRRRPRFSVVVCSYNGSRTIRECLEGVSRLEYPDFEVVVVDDGSTDDTGDIADEFGFRVIRTPQRGLSNARNTGMRAATGEIIAYLDDDAWPDPHWLSYLAEGFEHGHAAVGGPNVPPPGDGLVAECVADSPGNPTHVLLSDREAEHLPGCNLVIRKECLEAIGGFDPRFRTAGDDVDVCWRLRERGLTLGFHPSALVWHHRRGRVGTYWRQQRGYGRAEGLLEAKWPEKYNGSGHLSWSGRVYAGPPLGRTRVYHGVWGTAAFQSIYAPAPSSLGSLALMPEWLLAGLALTALGLLGLSWPPLALAAPLGAALLVGSLVRAVHAAARAPGVRAERAWLRRIQRFGLTAALQLLQPLARLRGRIESGLTFWQRRRLFDPPWRARRRFMLWGEHSQEAGSRLRAIEEQLRDAGAPVQRGGACARFDLEVRAGVLGAARLLMGLEEHRGGRQLIGLRCWPRPSPTALALGGILGALGVAAGLAGAWPAALGLGAAASLLLVRVGTECGSALAALADRIDAYAKAEALEPIRRDGS